MNKHTLICEDSLTTAYCIKEMLAKIGYSAEIVGTAKEALELLKKNKYDLLTLDIMLPDKNGIEVVKEIQSIELAKDLPIIVISATKREDSNLNFDKNIVYWIEKSFDMSTFEAAVEQVMEQKNRNKVNILHVENDKDLLNIIEITLNDIANVTQASNLATAKEMIEKNQFDLIVLDYVFPEGTSDKLIPAIKSGVNKNAKIVMFSAYEENKILERYVDKIIIKTNISFDEFRTCIENLISLKR